MQRSFAFERYISSAIFIALLAGGAVGADDSGVVAELQIASGSHAGKYTYESTDACVIAAVQSNQPAGFSVALVSERSSLAIDMPSVDPAHVGEIQIELVVADVKAGQSRKNTATTKYIIDTRPDASLLPYQREERGSSGISGKATVQFEQARNTAKVQFQVQTAAGVKIEGNVDCRRVDREYGR